MEDRGDGKAQLGPNRLQHVVATPWDTFKFSNGKKTSICKYIEAKIGGIWKWNANDHDDLSVQSSTLHLQRYSVRTERTGHAVHRECSGPVVSICNRSRKKQPHGQHFFLILWTLHRFHYLTRTDRREREREPKRSTTAEAISQRDAGLADVPIRRVQYGPS